MPVTRTATSTTYDLAAPIVLTASQVYLSSTHDGRSIVVEQVTVVDSTDGDGERLSLQILITGYVTAADGERGARVFGTPVTDVGQRADLIAHIAQEG